MITVLTQRLASREKRGTRAARAVRRTSRGAVRSPCNRLNAKWKQKDPEVFGHEI
jgi:hypothetical protein